MKLSDIGRPVADWLFQAQGYDPVHTRFTDRTGLENHLVKVAGSVAYATHSSIPGLSLVGTNYYDVPSFLPTIHTLAFVFHALLDATGDGEDFHVFNAEPNSYESPGDPDWEVPDDYGTMSAAGKNLAYDVRGNLNAEFGAFHTAEGAAVTTYTASAWHVYQAVMNPVDGLLKIRIDKGAIVTLAVTDGPHAVQYTENIRFGHRNTGITTSGGKHLTVARGFVFNDDMFKTGLGDMNDLVDELLADPATVGT